MQLSFRGLRVLFQAVMARKINLKNNDKTDGKRRGRGRPKKGESPKTPEVAQKIGELFLKGATFGQIASEVGLDKAGVWHHVHDEVQPELRKSEHCDLEADLKETKKLATTAWKAFGASKDLDDLALAKWAIEHRAKIFGHYAPTKQKIETQDEIRIAGMSAADLDAEILGRVMRGMMQQELEK